MKTLLAYKLNVKAVLMCCVIILIISGILFITQEIKDTGSIDIKTPLVTGGGSVGICWS